MDDAGLFFSLSESQYVIKLSTSHKKYQPSSCESRVFLLRDFERNGGTLKNQSITIQTIDTLGSRDLLTLMWYMIKSGIYDLKEWNPSVFPPYAINKRNKGRNFRVVAKGTVDLSTIDLCFLAHNRVLEVVGDITRALNPDAKIPGRLPKGGAAGLVFFLCKSRATLASGSYRKWCNYVIHHFDPDIDDIDDKNDQINELAKDITSKLVISKKKNLPKPLPLPEVVIVPVVKKNPSLPKDISTSAVVNLVTPSKNTTQWKSMDTSESMKRDLDPNTTVFIHRLPRSDFTKKDLLVELKANGFVAQFVNWRKKHAFVVMSREDVASIITKPRNFFSFAVSRYEKPKATSRKQVVK